MNTDQRIALLSAATALAAAESRASDFTPKLTLQQSTLHFYTWLHRVVSCPYDCPTEADLVVNATAEVQKKTKP
jgi:hypothetical protein